MRPGEHHTTATMADLIAHLVAGQPVLYALAIVMCTMRCVHVIDLLCGDGFDALCRRR
jgi:hypothetical protein